MLLISMAFAINACNNPTSSTSTVDSKTGEKVIYTCTMHPEVQVDKPGKCPKCGMELVIKEDSVSDTMQMQPGDTMKMK